MTKHNLAMPPKRILFKTACKLIILKRQYSSEDTIFKKFDIHFDAKMFDHLYTCTQNLDFSQHNMTMTLTFRRIAPQQYKYIYT